MPIIRNSLDLDKLMSPNLERKPIDVNSGDNLNIVVTLKNNLIKIKGICIKVSGSGLSKKCKVLVNEVKNTKFDCIIQFYIHAKHIQIENLGGRKKRRAVLTYLVKRIENR